MTEKQLLNGTWKYRIGKGKFTDITVPYSARPVGHSECVCRFDCKILSPKTFLRLDGINYFAEIVLNGKKIGEMLPYCTYIFDITETVMPAGNELCVILEDISPVFGPSEGWENYGGIPRDVMLLYRDEQYITDVEFVGKPENGYTDAEMCVKVKAHADKNAECRITLYEDDKEVTAYTQSVNCEPVSVHIKDIKLWSPDDPVLYRMKTELVYDGKTVDTDERSVGFREFKVGAKRFYLNGKPTFLTGVCYHELYGTCGHLVSDEQTERDFRMIKSMGCNYVRLVHYPHKISTLELADKLGLMVSEEPGLWWSDTSDPQIHDGSIEVLRRTIRRDITHPSIIFWLCFNECKFTEQYLIDSAKACKKADPSRPVSGANCMSLEDTPVYFNLCGFDFYTMHPYDRSTDRLIASVKALTDKPLMFTEWGGYYVTDNPQLFEDFVDTMTAYWRNPDDGEVLAGASYWCFADMYEFGRRRPAVKDGILYEGLVDTERRPNMVYDSFCRAFSRLNERHTPQESFEFRYLSDKRLQNTLELPFQDCGAYELLLEDMRAPVERYVHSTKRSRAIVVGPKTADKIPGLSEIPLVAADTENVNINVGKKTSLLTITGGTASCGYPIKGIYGEVSAELTLVYEDGEEKLELRNGVDTATVFGTYGPSRICPTAENAEPYLIFSYDKSHENYILQTISVKTDPTRILKEIALRTSAGYLYLIYAVTAE